MFIREKMFLIIMIKKTLFITIQKLQGASQNVIPYSTRKANETIKMR